MAREEFESHNAVIEKSVYVGIQGEHIVVVFEAGQLPRAVTPLDVESQVDPCLRHDEAFVALDCVKDQRRSGSWLVSALSRSGGRYTLRRRDTP